MTSRINAYDFGSVGVSLGATPPAPPPVQRLIRTGGDLPIQPTDSQLNVALTGSLTIPVPQANTRNGALLTFFDVAGNWSTVHPTFTAASGDTFDGLTTIVGQVNFGRLSLRPANDGVTAGYKIVDANL